MGDTRGFKDLEYLCTKLPVLSHEDESGDLEQLVEAMPKSLLIFRLYNHRHEDSHALPSMLQSLVNTIPRLFLALHTLEVRMPGGHSDLGRGKIVHTSLERLFRLSHIEFGVKFF